MSTLQTMPPESVPAVSYAGGGSAIGRLAARSFLYAVCKHKWLVGGVFAIVALASAVAAFSRPRAWLAQSKVLVKLGETVQLAPAEAPSRSVNFPLSQDVVRTEVDIVKSWDVVKEAIDRLGVRPGEGTMADLIVAIRGALNVAPAPGTNMLKISLIGRDPERAARLVNAITDIYIDHHNRVYQREGIRSFYARELDKRASELEEARKNLQAYMDESDITDIDVELKMTIEDAATREQTLRMHRGKVAALENRLAEVDGQLSETPETIPYTEEYQVNPVIGVYSARLAELELRRGEALQRYLPADRHVQDIEREIAELRGNMRRQQDEILGKHTVRRNELYVELERRRSTILTALTEAHSREPSRVAAVESAQRRLVQLRDHRFTVKELERVLEQKQYAYDLYFKRGMEAAASEANPDLSMVSVSVVEHAQPPLTPENSPLLPLMLGLVGGLALATAMAVGVEFLNQRLRFEEEVEHYLDLPVLAVIPDFETAPELLNA
jgi:succinoglycan biosynthesis transport protein ExoP